jgi:hypothetical protein
LSEADIAKDMRDCDTRSFQVDSATVVRAGRDAAVLNYRVQVERTCGGQPTPGTRYLTEVWVGQGGRWQLVAAGFTPQQAGQ